MASFPYTNPDPNPNHTHFSPIIDQSSFDFELLDDLLLGDDVDQASSSQSVASSWEKTTGDGGGAAVDGGSSTAISSDTTTNIKFGAKKNKAEVVRRVAFRTKTELEIMDDGFKWRKYGKKSVKNSPYLRNYYKCSSRGCCVKKRVERDREDASYVITTYQGVHNHESPFVIYYNQMQPPRPSST